MRFAINHISVPKLPLPGFLDLAQRLGVAEVEIRNDLPDLVGALPAAQVRAEAARRGIDILSINALYPFNRLAADERVRARALHLADYAQAAGARALVMCPLNEGIDIPFEDLVQSLAWFAPELHRRGLIGLVEPLGFPVSSLRRKSVALEAIRAAEAEGVYKLVHDTFHHHLAGETAFFAEQTGLVHISGVTDPSVAVEAMLDAHRVLVDAQDRLGNIAQIRALLAAGYQGPFSFEPFAEEVHALADPESALRTSMNDIRARV